LQAVVDRGHGALDLATDEGLTAQRALMIEQDARILVQMVGMGGVERRRPARLTP
jgi:hypothetical protein